MKPIEGASEDARALIVALRVHLVGSRPEIWRELEVPGSISLSGLHHVLQRAFGWEDAHLHRFTSEDPFAPLRPVNGELPEQVQWLPRSWCEEPTDWPEGDWSLDQLLSRGSGAAFYEYDFGDSWLHQLRELSRRANDQKVPVGPRLVDGARRGPFEDRGGLPGYEQILDALADPEHPDHADYSEWWPT